MACCRNDPAKHIHHYLTLLARREWLTRYHYRLRGGANEKWSTSDVHKKASGWQSEETVKLISVLTYSIFDRLCHMKRLFHAISNDKRLERTTRLRWKMPYPRIAFAGRFARIGSKQNQAKQIHSMIHGWLMVLARRCPSPDHHSWWS